MDMVRRTGQMGVPVTFIGDKFIVGYDPETIKELLKESSILE
jgi:glutaredoxin